MTPVIHGTEEYNKLIDRLNNAGVLNSLIESQPIAVGNGWDIVVFKRYRAIEAYLLQEKKIVPGAGRSLTMYDGNKTIDTFTMESAFVKLPNGNTEAIFLRIFKRPQYHKRLGEIVGWAIV